MAYCNSDEWERCLFPQLPNLLTYSGFIATSATLLPLAWISVLLRCYVKTKILKRFQVDDWLMVFSLGLFTTVIAMALRAASLGFGRRMVDISPSETVELLQMWIFGELCYLFTTVTVKLSIAVLLSRLAKQRGYRIIVWATAIFSSMASLVFVFVVILQCSPIPFYWDKTLPGVCKDRDTFALGSYIDATLSAMTNAIYVLTSILIVWNMEMDLKGKVSGGILLTLGVLASVASLIRVKYVDELAGGTNDSFALFVIGILNQLEVGLTIVAGSLATCYPLLYVFGKPVLSKVSDTSEEIGKVTHAIPDSRNGIETLDGPKSFTTVDVEKIGIVDGANGLQEPPAMKASSGANSFKPAKFCYKNPFS